MKQIIIILTIVMIALLLSGCEKEPVIVQDIESNSVITYVVKSYDPSQTIYCEYIDPDFGSVPQRVVLSNLGETPWTHNVIAKGDIEQYRIYFRYYSYMVTDLEYEGGGISVIFLDSDFTKEPYFSIDILVDGVSKRRIGTGWPGLFPRKDGPNWNHCSNSYMSMETYGYYWDRYLEQHNDTIDYHIYLPLERWFDEDGKYMGFRVKK